MGIKITAVGDLHFGNPRIKADEMYAKLQKYLYPEILTSHLVLLTGDTYDQLTTVSSSANKYALMFIRDLFNMSRKYGIQIRILHGTYSHDRDQVVVFGTLISDQVRAKVVDEIYCEEITDFCNSNINSTSDEKLKVLYIPDNLPYKHSEDVIAHIRKILQVVGWDKVDLVLGHGTFAHALPNVSEEHLPACTYKLEQFDEFVNNNDLIVMGHIHTPSHRGNCYYCGSFERMTHGEEEPKGFFTFIHQTDHWNARFVEDKNAVKFISIQPQGDTTDSIVNDYIRQVEEDFPDHKGWVRVLSNSSEIRTLLHTVTVQKYPELKYSSKAISDEKLAIKIADISLEAFDDIKPNVHNLGDLVYQFLNEKSLLGNLTKEIVVEKVHTLILK